MSANNNNNNRLNGKEASQFKTILNYYEHKQYKKGLKVAESILKKYPLHGETLAMKGLFLSNLNKREEAHKTIKMGLRQNLTSHICWHVYGLLYRGEKNYLEAIKCYSHALKYDKQNVHIMRDYSLLQIQMRDYDGYASTRLNLLRLKPDNKMYWIGTAIAHHLGGDHEKAIQLIQSYEETFDFKPDTKDYEHSELLLYKNSIYEEKGDFNAALDNLESIKDNMLDMDSWTFRKARLLVKLDRIDEAKELYWSLFELNSDSKQYLDSYIGAKFYSGTTKGDDDNKGVLLVPKVDDAELIKFYQELKKDFPKSYLIQKSLLQLATDESSFKTWFEELVKPSLLKGVPSLFATIKDLYKVKWRIPIVEKVILDYYQDLTKNQGRKHFMDLLVKEASHDEDSSVESKAPPPTLIVWVTYFIAQHYDYLRDMKQAMHWIDIALEHTPTLPELYMTKARIYKHAGDVKTAAQIMDDARLLDLQDRFVNTKCTKYMLRNNDEITARSTIGLFTKPGTEPLDDLKDMQCMWYLTESANCFSRLQQNGKAIKYYNFVEKIFTEIFDDQFDFHNYCLRKMTLVDYVRLLRMEDNVRQHGYFVRAALGAIKTYLVVLDKDQPPLLPTTVGSANSTLNGNSGDDKGSGEHGNEDEDGLTPAERKKLARKARKAEAAAKAAQAEANSNSKENQGNNNSTKDASSSTPVDDDPEGLKLVSGDANEMLNDLVVKYLLPLNQSRPDCLQGWLYGVDVYTRCEKYMMAWKCIKRAYKLDKESVSLRCQMIKFFSKVLGKFGELNSSIQNVFVQEFKEFNQGGDIYPTFICDGENLVNKSLEQSVLDRQLRSIYNASVKPKFTKLTLDEIIECMVVLVRYFKATKEEIGEFLNTSVGGRRFCLPSPLNEYREEEEKSSDIFGSIDHVCRLYRYVRFYSPSIKGGVGESIQQCFSYGKLPAGLF